MIEEKLVEECEDLSENFSDIPQSLKDKIQDVE